jgi:glutathione reductase (NADPH)
VHLSDGTLLEGFCFFAFVVLTHSGFDAVLVAVGRSPNVENLNLDIAGVKLNDQVKEKKIKWLVDNIIKGYIVVDEYQVTSAENVYAVGDVCGVALLTPVAIAAGRKCNTETNKKFKLVI